MAIDKSKTLGLATRIVDDIIADPAKTDEFKQTLADTLADVFNSGETHRIQTGLSTSKHFLMSKTFWGVVISGVASIAGKFGHKIGQEEIVAYTTTAVELVGTGLALYGRYVAKEDLTWKTSE